MPKRMGFSAARASLAYIRDNADVLRVLSTAAMSYAQTTGNSNNQLVSANVSAADFSIASGSTGPVLTIAQKTNHPIDINGQATHVALTRASSTSLLLIANCSVQALVSGNFVDIPSWTVTSEQSAGTVLSGVTVGAGQQFSTLTAALAANPAGTTYLVAAGTHTDANLAVKSGDTIIGVAGATACVFNGGGGTTERHFTSPAVGTSAVTIRGLTITNYVDNPTPNLFTGVFHTRPDRNTTRWTIENCVINNNRGAGIDTSDFMTITNNVIHSNTLLGIRGGLSAADVWIEGNHIYNNNTDQSSPHGSTAFASAIKLFRNARVTIKDNNIHENYGFGIWFDFDWHHVVITGNEIWGQRGVASDAADSTRKGVGIYLECGLVGGSAKTNSVTNNYLHDGVDGMIIANSSDLVVANNRIRATRRPIHLFETDRGTSPVNGALIITSNVAVTANQIAYPTGQIEAEDRNGFGDWEVQNVLWRNNSYYLATLTNAFRYVDGAGAQNLTPTQWQARGHDTDSTFTVNGGNLP
jgi:hypothetical protein